MMQDVPKQRNYFLYWGKAERQPLQESKESLESLSWHPLVLHLLDTAAVARQFCIENPDFVRQWQHCFGPKLEKEEFLDLVSFFAAIHDLGKFAADFQCKIPELAGPLLDLKEPSASGGAHSASAWMLRNRLQEMLPSDTTSSDDFLLSLVTRGSPLEPLVSAAFGHHGTPTPPEHERLLSHQLFSYETCLAAQVMLTDFLELFPKLKSTWPKLNQRKERIPLFSWPLSGLIVLSDWVASATSNFPHAHRGMKFLDEAISREDQKTREVIYREMPALAYETFFYKEKESKEKRLSYLRNGLRRSKQKAKYALARQGLRTVPVQKLQNPWQGLFRNTKQKAKTPSPRPLQKYLNEAPLPSHPALYIIEDTTGSGKTEAALLLAARLMQKGNASGFYFALPTMATSNGMYPRIASLYRRFFEKDTNPSLVLAHSARNLHKEFQESQEYFFAYSLQSGLDAEDFAKNGKTSASAKLEANSAASCSEWISDQPRKAFLAQVGVGSIDQAMIAVLYSRFNSLRLFGLSQKILILDEVHAYDAYMQTIIGNLLHFQASQRQSVILLSATLPLFLKKRLSEAYLDGLRLLSTKSPKKKTKKRIGISLESGKEESTPQSLFQTEKHKAYPLLTLVGMAKQKGKAGTEKPHINSIKIQSNSPQERSTKVEFFTKNDEALAFLKNSTKNGKCAVWIRNTVADAQKSYEDFLQAGFPEDKLHLFHSRFIMEDRQKIETEMLARFGKESSAKERNGHLLIATQVVEQSLDLDFDEMVTDLCPIDLILQRAGRLRRHARDEKGNPASEDTRGSARLCLLGPHPTSDAGEDWYADFFPKGAWVYPHHGLLWKTSQLLQKEGALVLPGKARYLIEAVYSILDDDSSDAIQELPTGLQNRERQAMAQDAKTSSKAQNSLIQIGKGYLRTSDLSPWDDRQAPTRHFEEGREAVSYALCLDDASSKQFVPLAQDPNHPWAMSEVRWSKAPKTTFEYSCKAQKKIEATKQKFPGHLRWRELLPMQKTKEGRFQSLGSSEGRHLIYDRKRGLSWENPNGKSPTKVGNG